jgi:hypothetical protein
VVHKQSRAILALFLVVLVSGIGPAVLAHGGGGVSVATPTPTEAPEEEQQPEREGEAPPEGGGTAEPEEETGTEGEPGEGESGESFILDLVPFCEPYAATPRIESNTVIGNGRAVGGTCSSAVSTVKVCLDYNLLTLELYCRTYPSSSGGDSGPAPCLVGIWDTMVTVTYKSGVVEVAHSGFLGEGSRIVTTQCR